MTCKGICIGHKAQPIRGAKYSNGQKRCQKWEIFVVWPAICCPCCGRRLRMRPRNSKCKAKLRRK